MYRYTYQNELDQEKVTGDFDRDPDVQNYLYHANSYIDTYEPQSDMYTNTEAMDT